jgi:photosystem II stability/assembly factor-like uncharacterized protein
MAQWQKSMPLGIYANDVYFTSDKVGYIAGSLAGQGIIIKTTNSGVSWTKVSPANSSTFRSIWFTNASTGFALAENTLLQTTDEGSTWNRIAFIDGNPLKLQFTSPQIGYIGGQNGTVLKTTDGGKTWKNTRVPTSGSDYYNAMSFASDSVGYVSSDFEFFKTSDGGSNWKKLDFNNRILSIDFLNEKTGYLSTYFGGVYQTIDGGETWSPRSGSADFIYFIDELQGLLFDNYSVINRTDDGVMTVSNVYQSRYTFSWKAAHFPTKEFGCAIGDDGAILLSHDGGRSWQMSNPPSSNLRPYHDMHFSSSQKGMVVGEFSGIIRTANGGTHWYIDEKTFGRDDNYGLYFSSPDTGMVVVTNNYSFLTYDGGQTFTYDDSRQPPFIGHGSSSDYFFVNSQVVFSTGRSVGYGGRIAKSTDGGRSWAIDNNPPYENYLTSITFPSPDTGYACGMVGKVVKTVDGGQNWQEQAHLLNNDLRKIYFRNPHYGFAVGQYGAIIRTTDGGSHWTEVSLDIDFPLVAIHFFTDSLGYVASSAGHLARTTNGGLTWKVITNSDESVSEAVKYYFKDTTSVIAMATYGIYQRDLTDRNFPPPSSLVTGLPQEEPQSANQGLRIYPNPVHGTMHLTFPPQVEAKEISIYNSLGSLIHASPGSPRAQPFSLDVSGLPPGMYLLHVESKQKSVLVSKFIKY